MPDAKLAVFIEQLRSDDPKERAKACAAMGKLGDPEAIPHLSRVYQRLGEDEKVVAAAEKALRKFVKQMPDAPGTSRGILSAKFARTLAMGLTASLVVLLLLNVLLRMGGGDDETQAEVIEPTKIQTEPTNREDLLVSYETLFQNMLSNFNFMRTEWGGQLGQLGCDETQVKPMQETPLADIDRVTYPDFDPFVSALNGIVSRLQIVMDSWRTACGGTRGTFDEFNTANDSLNEIETLFENVATLISLARTNPAPTVGPTATLTPVPTNTLQATNTPVPDAPTATPEPTLTPSITPTPAPTIDPGVFSDITRRVENAISAAEQIKAGYWEPVQRDGSLPFGCNFTAQLPDLYPEDDAVFTNQPEFLQAVQLFNLGMGFLQTSVDSFTTKCIGGGVQAAVTQGIADADSALSNLTQAKTILDTLAQRE